jgi:MFS family permease
MSSDLILLGVSLMTWGVGEAMFLIFQPLYLQQLGASPVTIGAILGAAGIAMAAAHIPAGHLADRIGRRPLILAAWMMGIVATWVMALSRHR